MNNALKYILTIGGLVLIVAFGVLLSKTTENDTQENIQVESVDSTENLTDLKGIYEFYSEETLAVAKEKGTPLLFFKADWCPTCASAKRDIELNFEDLDETITVLEVDYDTEIELKKKFGITAQHTFVQLDSAGNEITKWLGGGVKTINDNMILE